MVTKLKKIVRKKSVKVGLFSFIVLTFVLVGLRITTVISESNFDYNIVMSQEKIALDQSSSEIMKDILAEVVFMRRRTSHMMTTVNALSFFLKHRYSSVRCCISYPILSTQMTGIRPLCLS